MRRARHLLATQTTETTCALQVPSECPFMTGAYAVAWTRGAQESSASPAHIQAIVTIKHLAAYSVDKYAGPDRPGPGSGGRDRYTFNAQINDYDMADTYTPPFEMAVRRANVRGIMCSYNEINNVPGRSWSSPRDV
jgi:beta-D-xylosidase 4